MLALTCDVCGKPATVFFKDGSASCNDHGQHFQVEQDFGAPRHTLGVEMTYDHDDRYTGVKPRQPAR